MNSPDLPDPKIPQNILIILPRQLGDVLLATSLPRVLKSQFPNAKVSWSTHPMAKQLLDGNPFLDEVLYCPPDLKTPKWNRRSGGLFSFVTSYVKTVFKHAIAEVAFIKLIRSREFDVVVDAMNNPRTAIQALLSGAKRKISFFARAPRNWVFNTLIDRKLLDTDYLTLARLRLLEPLGINIPTDLKALDTLIPVGESDVKVAMSYFKERTEQTGVKNFVILSATHRRPVRQWPGDHFVDLGLRIIKEHGDSVVWIWGPGERDFVDQWHQKLCDKLRLEGLNENLSQVAPLFTIRQTSVLCKIARGWVGNSNGLSHMAVAGGGKTVQIHGPTRPQSWTHPDTTRHRAVQRDQGCVQCGLNACKLPRRECLLDLTVDAVYSEVTSLFYES